MELVITILTACVIAMYYTLRKQKEESSSLIRASRIGLKNAERKAKDLTQENKALYEENKNLRFENEEQHDLIVRITNLLNMNKYNNEKAILDKIKELVSDFDSQN